ncbi:MAG: hypothetical protein WC938_03580 [Candidatus Paceibacterota bacterium]|jgi:hypothetical protein
MSTEVVTNEGLENTVENVLISKTKMIYGIIIVMIPILAFFFKIQLDIALIKENHEAHMEAALVKISNLEDEEQIIKGTLVSQNEAIIKLLFLHQDEIK